MKVDKINTKYGDIPVEYSSFKKGFFISSLPEKLHQVNGLEILCGRDHSFNTFSALESYIKDLINDANIDFEFEKKMIIYRITEESKHNDSLSFVYMICDVSTKNQKHLGKEKQLREYKVLESNLTHHVGKRNIWGQITYENESNYVFMDYDEKTHLFLKYFCYNFTKLKMSIVDFFKADKLKANILSKSNGLKLLGSNKES